MQRDGTSEPIGCLKEVEKIIDDFCYGNNSAIDIRMTKSGNWRCVVQKNYCKLLIVIADKTSLESMLSELIFEIKHFENEKVLH